MHIVTLFSHCILHIVYILFKSGIFVDILIDIFQPMALHIIIQFRNIVLLNFCKFFCMNIFVHIACIWAFVLAHYFAYCAYLVYYLHILWHVHAYGPVASAASATLVDWRLLGSSLSRKKVVWQRTAAEQPVQAKRRIWNIAARYRMFLRYRRSRFRSFLRHRRPNFDIDNLRWSWLQMTIDRVCAKLQHKANWSLRYRKLPISKNTTRNLDIEFTIFEVCGNEYHKPISKVGSELRYRRFYHRYRSYT
jgi:hypothetical protein